MHLATQLLDLERQVVLLRRERVDLFLEIGNLGFGVLFPGLEVTHDVDHLLPGLPLLLKVQLVLFQLQTETETE